MSTIDLRESQVINRLPPKSEYEIDTGAGINSKIADRLIGYRYRLTAVENSVVRQVLKTFNSLIHTLDTEFSDNNPELLRLLADARVVPSTEPVKTVDEVLSVQLSTSTILEARRRAPGAKSPLSFQGIQSITDYLTGEVDAALNSMVGTVSRTLRGVLSDVTANQPRMVAQIIRRLFPGSVARRLKGGVVLSDEPPLTRLQNIILGTPEYESVLRGRYGDALGKVRAQIASGLAFGKGIKSITTNVKSVMRSSFANTAARLVRTEIQQAAVKANDELFKNNSDIIKNEEWLATLDARVCLLCGSLDGKVFDVGKGPKPVEDTHPNCRCLRIPIIKSWRELGIDADEVPEGTRASMNGAVPAKTTFTDWFKSQSMQAKKEILGPGKFDLFKQNKLDIEDFVVNRRVLTMTQLKRRYNIKGGGGDY